MPEAVFKEQGIIAELIELNDPEHIRRSLGNYLIGHFKYEFFSNDYIGVDLKREGGLTGICGYSGIFNGSKRGRPTGSSLFSERGI